MLTTTQSYVQYQGNGATTVFPYSFLIPAAGDLVVTITNNNVSPAVTTLLQVTQYTVTGIGNATGGSVTYGTGSPLPIGWTITLQRVVPYLQNTSLTNQGALYPQVVEAALDYLTMLAQQLSDSPIVGVNPNVLATLENYVSSQIASFAPSGAWTPTLSFGGNSTGMTYSQQYGEYQVCGKLVICGWTIGLTSKGTSAGAAAIGGLPFTVSGDQAGGAVVGYDVSMATLSGPILGVVSVTTKTLQLFAQQAANVAPLTDANFTNTSLLIGSCMYFTG